MYQDKAGVIAEKRALDERLTRLQAHFKSDEWMHNTTQAEKTLLTQQAKQMQDYSNVLQQRADAL